MVAEQAFEVVLLSANRLPILSDLRVFAGNSFTIHEVRLNGRPLLHEADNLGTSTVAVVSHSDLATTLELIQALRRHREALVILVVTPEKGVDALLSIYAAGANDCISSEIGPELLMAKIRVWARWFNC